MNDWDLVDEELLRASGEFPRASQGLRRRVLRAARAAERRKKVHRRLLAAASLLLPAIALTAWYQQPGTRPEFDDSPRAAAAGLPTPADAWDQVDASISQRRRNSEAIRSSLY